MPHEIVYSGSAVANYDPDPPALTFTMQINGTAAGTARSFDQPLLIAGVGAAALAGSPTSLVFVNNLVPAKEVTAEIIVGRDAAATTP